MEALHKAKSVKNNLMVKIKAKTETVVQIENTISILVIFLDYLFISE